MDVDTHQIDQHNSIHRNNTFRGGMIRTEVYNLNTRAVGSIGYSASQHHSITASESAQPLSPTGNYSK